MPGSSSPPPGFPQDLPEGTTIADLPDHEIHERALVIARLFDLLNSDLQEYVAAGCPADQEHELLWRISGGLAYYVSVFRGASEWRESCEPAVRAALANVSLSGKLEDVSDLVMAALCCDAAFKAEEAFWETIRKHEKMLRQVEARRKDGLN